MEGSFVQFADVARTLVGATRRLGLAVPGFRSPPRLAGAVRTLRWRADGGAVVAVAVRGRSSAEVVADLVEGVVAANRLTGEPAARARAGLLAAVGTPEGAGRGGCPHPAAA